MNLCLRNCLRPSVLNSFVKLKYSTTSITEASETAEEVVIEDPEEVKARQAEIQKKRNVSRLSNAHFNLVNDRRPYETPYCLAHNTVKYHRKLYGKYGSTSGVNPSLCWPTQKEINEKLEYESIAYPFTIPQMMEMVAEKRRQEQLKIITRDNDVAAKFAKLEQWKKDLRDKIAKKTADADAVKVKKERLVEEVRRHFGFKLDPRDERFQEMLAKREKEQKKQEKMARKEEKEKQMLAKLQQKNVKITDKS